MENIETLSHEVQVVFSSFNTVTFHCSFPSVICNTDISDKPGHELLKNPEQRSAQKGGRAIVPSGGHVVIQQLMLDVV